MFQWFDSIEVTLRQSGCPENLRTLNATGVFQSCALDWWTAERNKRGNDAAYELTWEELKAVMMGEFCPPQERQKLEDEFCNIKQKEGENAALTTRFKQLSIIYPDQVKTSEMAIKKYIRALPDCVADFLAAEINDKRVKAGFWDKPSRSLHQATAAPTTDTTATPQSSKSSHRTKKNNNRNSSNKNCALAITTTAAPLQVVPAQQQSHHRPAPVTHAPPAKRAYTGPHPSCPTCSYHHPVGLACRFCAHCNVYDHFTANCHIGPRQAPTQATGHQALLPAPQGQQATQAPAINARVCFACGDPNHFANMCPNWVVKQKPQQQQQHQQQQPQQQQQAACTRTFNINARQAQTDNNVINGTFLVNGIYASCLFDTGADICFVSFEFEKLLSRKRFYLPTTFDVEVATRRTVAVNSVLRDCTLELNNHIFLIDLIPMQLGSFDIIVGMDFLRENHAEVVCFDTMI
ncbi:putative transcription factor interactor and regulator CCHC(Zn) family [Helianthus anomalus]